MSRGATHEVFNQSPPYGGINLFEADPLINSAAAGFPDSVRNELSDLGGFWGTHEAREFARLANRNTPTLERYDSKGHRIDQVLFHPAYHALMRRSMMAGLHCSSFDRREEEAGLRHRARAVRLYLTAQTECGHLCPMTMTNAALASLKSAPDLLGTWAPRILSRQYDHNFRPAEEKRSVNIGMGMTEKQGGSDVAANTTRGERGEDGLYTITGHKWFFSAPMSDAFLVVAQTEAGPTCFLMPRFLPDGSRNAIHLERLKDKLGNRSNASAEVEFHGAGAWRVGGEGRGIATILEMVALTRLDCAIASTGLMRAGLAEAVHHARHRSVFGKTLVDQPLMLRVLSDLALDYAAALALSLRLAEAYDMAEEQPSEAAYARLMNPAVKYWVCKTAPTFLSEAMECLGGNGYVEESALPRLYREAPVNAIWEGSGNIMALDVVRALRGEGILDQALETIGGELGGGSKAAVDVLRAAA
ncbi:MAG TPA: acyl-CoA dehydrogenase family protein, partial [Propylenella sp.]|nr:acyl-CoA dehydrogenase family protein [Propylenella sp.]